MTGPFLLNTAVFVSSFLHYSFCFFGSVMRQIKLASLYPSAFRCIKTQFIVPVCLSQAERACVAAADAIRQIKRAQLIQGQSAMLRDPC